MAERRILVVEDVALQREVLALLLAPFGRVEKATNGNDALKIIRESLGKGLSFDLVCLDIYMPGIDGYETLKELRIAEIAAGVKSERRSKVFMITASDDPVNLKQAFGHQCDGYILKPVRKTILYEELKKIGFIIAPAT